MVLSDRHYDATKCATSIVGDCLANDRDRLGRREAAGLQCGRHVQALRVVDAIGCLNGGVAPLFRIKDGHLRIWKPFLYLLCCLFGRLI